MDTIDEEPILRSIKSEIPADTTSQVAVCPPSRFRQRKSRNPLRKIGFRLVIYGIVVPLRCLQFGKLYCFAEQRLIAQWLLGIFYAQYLRILGGCLYVVIVLFSGAKYVGL